MVLIIVGIAVVIILCACMYFVLESEKDEVYTEEEKDNPSSNYSYDNYRVMDKSVELPTAPYRNTTSKSHMILKKGIYVDS